VTGDISGSADGTAATREIVPRMEEQSAACRVLVVDDEPLIRWAIAETLSELGYSVVEAGDGESARRVLAEASKPVDVILLDYRLPDSDNLTLLSTIRRMAPTSQVILMTAIGTPDLIQGAIDHGACRVMNKPFEMGEVAAVVQHALQGRPH
jgi:DNA-binding NtrC family response regulator